MKNTLVQQGAKVNKEKPSFNLPPNEMVYTGGHERIQDFKTIKTQIQRQTIKE